MNQNLFSARLNLEPASTCRSSTGLKSGGDININIMEKVEKPIVLRWPQRKTWPRRAPYFAKVVLVPRNQFKTQRRNASPRQSRPPAIANGRSPAFEYLCYNYAGYMACEFLTNWAMVLLYNPFELAMIVLDGLHRMVTNIPPFITFVCLPAFFCYALYSVVSRVLSEYQAYLDLGRGGTPSTPIGLIKVTIKKFFARVEVLEPPHIDPMLEPYRGRLFNLKKRAGARPIVRGVAPQRQLDQKTPSNTFDKLLYMLKDVAEGDDNLKVTTSYLEGHTDALKAIFADRPHKVMGTDSEWDYEIAHPHRIDGSMHVILHPEDVRTVIETGWGERHPLATDSFWWRTFYHYIYRKRRPTPYNLVFVYTPRTATEFHVVRQIIDAAVWFMKEKDICDKIRNGLLVRSDDGNILTRQQALSSRQWVEGSDGKLVAHWKVVDNGLYEDPSHGTIAVPTSQSEMVRVPPKCCKCLEKSTW